MTVFQLLSDFGVFLGWFFNTLKTIFLALLSPITFIFSYFKIIFSAIFSPIGEPELTYTFSADILEVFNAIPHWSLFSTILGTVVILVLGVSTVKILLRS